MREKSQKFLKTTAYLWILILILSFLACGAKDVAYYHALGVQAERDGKIDEAKNAYLEALKQDPDHRSSLFNLGNTYSFKKSWEDARESYIRGLIGNTNNAPAWCNLGLTYLQIKERAKAYSCFTYAWALDPGMTQALISHAAALAEEGKERDAARILQKGNKSEDGRIFFNLGMLQFESGDYTAAAQNFSKAAEYSPDELRIYIMQCRNFMKLDKNAEALAALNTVRDLDTMGWQVDLLKAELDFRNNRLAEAETALSAHLALFPDSYNGLLILGEIAAKKEQYELAYTRFARAAAVDYTRKEAALREVDALFALKRMDDARDRLSVLSGSFPEDPRILDGLMRTYFQQGYYDKAAVYGEKRLALPGTKKELGEAEVITGLSHIMNEDLTKRSPESAVKYLWPHRSDEPKNRLMLRYLYGALVELKDDTRADVIRRML